MSYFGTKLRISMEKFQMTLEDVRRISGYTTGTISNICTGKQKTITREQTEKLIGAFGDNETITQLAVAHLQDEFPAQAKELVHIGSSLLKPQHEYNIIRLDDDFESAIDRARRAIPHNEDLRLAIIDLVNACCGRSSTKIEKSTHDPQRIQRHRRARFAHRDRKNSCQTKNDQA